MAQGYTQPVLGLAFLGFCSAGKRYLPQEAKLPSKPPVAAQ